MSDDKSKVADKAGEIAKNIWLAGVGAYGRAVDEAQDRLEKSGVETPKLFKDLVKAGAALEEEARDGAKSVQKARSSVEERINKVRENFHMQRPTRLEDVAELSAKVELLSRKIDVLTNALAESGVIGGTKTPRKKAATKKAPAKKAAAKSATRKPARKTSSAKKASSSRKTKTTAR